MSTSPGADLDALVHAHVFGLCPHAWRERHGGDAAPRCSKCGISSDFVYATTVPPYSTSAALAWSVAERLRLDGSLVSVHARPDGTWETRVEYALNPRGDGTADGWDETLVAASVRTLTMPHGVCLVAVAPSLPEDGLDPYLAACPDCGRDVLDHARDCVRRA